MGPSHLTLPGQLGKKNYDQIKIRVVGDSKKRKKRGNRMKKKGAGRIATGYLNPKERPKNRSKNTQNPKNN